MTENHDYEQPTRGTTDWHVPLNANFDLLDQDVEIRDVEANRGNYVPKQNAKFLATDTGRVYIGNGTGWGFLGEIVPEQGAGTGGGIESLLQQGLIVGTTPVNTIVEDPRDHGTHDAAIQAAVDAVEATGYQGFVYMPSVPSDDSQLLIENTVFFSNRCLPRGYGFGRNNPYIDTTINDGSPMFRVGPGQAQSQVWGGFNVTGIGQDAEAVRVHDLTAYTMGDMDVRGLGTSNPSARGAYVFDGGANNSAHYNLRYNQRGPGGQNATVTGMNAWAFEESGGQDPSEHVFYGLSTYADPGAPFNDTISIGTSGASNLKFVGCRFEGAGGTGHLSGSTGSAFFFGTEFGRTETGASGIDFTGFKLQVQACTFAGTQDGHGIRFAPGRGVIGPFWCNARGHDLVITNDTVAPNKVTIPDPASLAGTADIPSGTSNIHILETRTA